MAELTYDEFMRALETATKFRDHGPRNLSYFCGGTGLPDSFVVKFFRDADVYVYTRDGTTWWHGEVLTPAQHLSMLSGCQIYPVKETKTNRAQRRELRRQQRKHRSDQV